MSILVRVQHKGQMTIPSRVRSALVWLTATWWKWRLWGEKSSSPRSSRLTVQSSPLPMASNAGTTPRHRCQPGRSWKRPLLRPIQERRRGRPIPQEVEDQGKIRKIEKISMNVELWLRAIEQLAAAPEP